MKIQEIILESKKLKSSSIKNFSKNTQVPKKLGGGIISESRNYDKTGKLIEYKLAYINPLIYSCDNGRVLGYDNADGVRGRPGSPHKHFMGKRTNIKFTSFEELQDRFEKEWIELAQKYMRGEI